MQACHTARRRRPLSMKHTNMPGVIDRGVKTMANTIPVQQQEFTTTQSEQSLRLFEQRAEQIPGVVSIKRHLVGRSAEEGVTVVVANLFNTITEEVIRAQESVYDTIPGVRFCLEIKDASTVVQSDL
jgi:hypothetical protein